MTRGAGGQRNRWRGIGTSAGSSSFHKKKKKKKKKKKGSIWEMGAKLVGAKVS